MFLALPTHSINQSGGQTCIRGLFSWSCNVQFYSECLQFFFGIYCSWAVLTKHLEGLPVDKSLWETRWSARGDAEKALNSGYKEKTKAFEEITADPQQYAETRNEASGLLQCIEKLETAILLELWNDILQQFQKTSCSLEKVGLPLNCALNLLDSLLKFVEPLRDKFDEYEKNGARSVAIANMQMLQGAVENEIVVSFSLMKAPLRIQFSSLAINFVWKCFLYSCRPHMCCTEAKNCWL